MNEIKCIIPSASENILRLFVLLGIVSDSYTQPQWDFPYIVNLLAEGFNLQQTNRVTSISAEGTREVLTCMFALTQKPALRGELTKKTLLWFK